MVNTREPLERNSKFMEREKKGDTLSDACELWYLYFFGGYYCYCCCVSFRFHFNSFTTFTLGKFTVNRHTHSNMYDPYGIILPIVHKIVPFAYAEWCGVIVCK